MRWSETISYHIYLTVWKSKHDTIVKDLTRLLAEAMRSSSCVDRVKYNNQAGKKEENRRRRNISPGTLWLQLVPVGSEAMTRGYVVVNSKAELRNQ